MINKNLMSQGQIQIEPQLDSAQRTSEFGSGGDNTGAILNVDQSSQNTQNTRQLQHIAKRSQVLSSTQRNMLPNEVNSLSQQLRSHHSSFMNHAGNLDNLANNFNSLKARLQRRSQANGSFSQFTLTNDVTNPSQTSRVGAYAQTGLQGQSQDCNALTKQELKALKNMNKNREMYQMLGRTRTGNNEKYLTRGQGLRSRSRSIASQGSVGQQRSRNVSTASKRSNFTKTGVKFNVNQTIQSQRSRRGSNLTAFSGMIEPVQNNIRKSRSRSKKKAGLGFKAYYDAISGVSHGQSAGGRTGSAGERGGTVSDIRIDVMAGQPEWNGLETGSGMQRSPTQKFGTTQRIVSGQKMFKQRSNKRGLFSQRGLTVKNSQTFKTNPRLFSAEHQLESGQTDLNTQRAPIVQNNNDDLDFNGLQSPKYVAQTAQNSQNLLRVQTHTNSSEIQLGPGSIVSPHNRNVIQMQKRQLNLPSTANNSAMQTSSQMASEMKSNIGTNPGMRQSQGTSATDIMASYRGLNGALYTPGGISKGSMILKKPSNACSGTTQPSKTSASCDFQQFNFPLTQKKEQITAIDKYKEKQMKQYQILNLYGELTKRENQSVEQQTGTDDQISKQHRESQIKKLELEKLMQQSQTEEGSLQKTNETYPYTTQVSKRNHVQFSKELTSGSVAISSGKRENFSFQMPVQLFQNQEDSASKVMGLGSEISIRKTRNKLKPLKQSGKMSREPSTQTFRQSNQTGGVYYSISKKAFKTVKGSIYENLMRNPSAVHASPAPREKIEGLKRETNNIKSDNEKYRDMIENLDEKFKKVSTNIAEMKKKSCQATSDKIELMRDLATYEVNFTDMFDIHARLSKILKNVKETKTLVIKQHRFNDENEMLLTTKDGVSTKFQNSQTPQTGFSRQNKSNGTSEQINADIAEEMKDEVGIEGQSNSSIQQNGGKWLKDSQIQSIMHNLTLLQNNRRSRHHSLRPTEPNSGPKKYESRIDNFQVLDNKEESDSLIQTPHQLSQINQNQSPNHQLGSQNSSVNNLNIQLINSATKNKEKGVKNENQNITSKTNIRVATRGIGGFQRPTANDDDEIYQEIIISGLSCVITARNVNGMIKGHLTSQNSQKIFKFDMNPSRSKKTHIDVKSEIQRLYFGIRRNKNGKDQLSLTTKESIEDAERVKSFLVKIQGGFSKQINVDVEVLAERFICKISIKVKDHFIHQDIQFEQVLRFMSHLSATLSKSSSSVPNLSLTQRHSNKNIEPVNVAEFVQQTMILMQRPTGQFHLFNKDDAELIYKQDVETVYKNKYLSKYTKQNKLSESKGTERKFKTLESKDLQKIKRNLLKRRTVTYEKMGMLKTSPERQVKEEGNLSNFFQKSVFGNLGGLMGQFALKNQMQQARIPMNIAQDQPKKAPQINPLVFQKIQFSDADLKKINRRYSIPKTFFQLEKVDFFTAHRFHYDVDVDMDNTGDDCNLLDRQEKSYDGLAELAKKAHSFDKLFTQHSVEESEVSEEKPQSSPGKNIVEVEKSKNDYILAMKIQLLRAKFVKLEEILSQTEQQQDDLDQYELLYGLRLAKSCKKYTLHKNLQEKQKALDKQKEVEQVEIIDQFFDEIHQKPQLKNRISERHNKTIKKKYFRQPKIYQNEYIVEIQNNDQIVDYFTQQDELDPNQNVLMLFFIENNDIMLLLGREMAEKSKSGVSSASPSQSEALYQIESDKESKDEEEDDDSPYFVKITIDSGFLSHLEEPGLVDCSELNNQFDTLISNKIFQEIIKREIEMMFGANNKPGQQNKVQDAKSSQVAGNSNAGAPGVDVNISLAKDSIDNTADEKSPRARPSQQIDKNGAPIGTNQFQAPLQNASISDHGSIKKSNDSGEKIKKQFEQKLKSAISNFSQILNYK